MWEIVMFSELGDTAICDTKLQIYAYVTAA
jgi:hypothetical protein